MRNVFKNIFALIILGGIFFVFQEPIIKSFFIFQDKFFPCTRLVSYSIGTFDNNFGISREDFLKIIKEGEEMWETTIQKDLFVYKEDGSGELKINLIYDSRQEATQKLEEIDSLLEGDKSSYDDLKSQIGVLQEEFKEKKAILELKVATFESLKNKYEKEVIHWNSLGGAPKNILNDLEKERKVIENSLAEIRELQKELDNEVNKINALVDDLNKFASSFNNQAKEFNNIGDELGEEFEEGIYHSDRDGKRIEIYQFENRTKLKRVLMHELGHALLLGHVDDKEAIMYRLNNGNSLIPAKSDINALKTQCGLK